MFAEALPETTDPVARLLRLDAPTADIGQMLAEASGLSSSSHTVSRGEFGSAEDYLQAFQRLRAEGRLREGHLALVRAHYAAEGHTVSWNQLAQAVGYAEGRAVNLQYGKFGRLLAESLGAKGVPPDFQLFVLVSWADEKDERNRTRFTLRPEAVEALRRAGIVQDEIPLFTQGDFQEEFLAQIEAARKLSREERAARLADFPRLPEKRLVKALIFVRNPYVVAEVLERAEGVCEGCKEPAPFVREANGKPYLEVHHRKWLARGGEDTVENAVALCPNCHRREHYG